ncbi:MAG: TonB-dependent receptor [Acidobacteria bacterium]|nr:TonB-dependent receptor [Acidobacteriota bacterium]
MFRRCAFVPILAALAAFLLAPAASGQTPTGTISGRVLDTEGLRVPGVTVTLTSPNLQGVRTAVTSENGDFVFPALTPGEYTAAFELPGFGTVRETRSVAAGQPVNVDVTMRPAAVSEELTVTGRTDAFTNTVQAATTIQAELLQQLPSTRTVLGAVNLAPGVHATGPNNNISISGAMSFENVFLLNGVQITDNIRGTPFNLFIEDAIQETTVSTSGISAEYGRFTGGVVNAVTKSGGNTFSGSYRATLTNDDWRTSSPFGEPRTNDVVPVHEFTLGGPVLRDRTWFFGAGRLFGSSVSNQTGYTNLPYNFEVDEKRFEGKLTQSLGTGHTARAAYTHVQRDELNNAFPSPQTVMDRRSLYDRQLPQQLLSVHYSGTLRNNFFVEAQYAARSFTFEGSGAKTRDLIDGTVLQDRTTGARWWSPTFCGVCTDEERANDNILVKANYFLSTRTGSHNLVVGYDTFNDKRIGDNNQSGSDFHVWASGSIIEGDTIYPVLRPDGSTWIIWWPVQEASRGTRFRTHSLFVNDTWAFNRHLMFNLGLRWDRNDGRDNIGQRVARDSEFSPRVGLVWDPTGAGRWGVNASVGRYVASLNNAIADSTSPAGTPSIYAYDYLGDPINAAVGAPRVPTDEALRMLFASFEALGGTSQAPWLIDVPGTSTQIRGSLRSPSADEFAVGLSRQLGTRGALRADLAYRNFNNFYSDRVDTSTGQVVNAIGDEFDLVLVENTDELERQYVGLSLQANYRLGTRTSLGGNYTLSRLWGNLNGENVGSGPLSGTIHSYPEYFDRSWAFPEGDLASDQRHRVRLWGNVDVPFVERFGRLNLGVVQQVQSGTPYGASGLVRTGAFVQNPGYLTPPVSVTYSFTDRDHFRTETMQRTDLALNYSFRLPGGPDRRELFAQFQVLNAFNTFQLFNISTNAINSTVLTAFDAPTRFEPFNPFTDTPVQGVHWDYGDRFGQATGAAAYTLPRTFQVAVGFRF